MVAVLDELMTTRGVLGVVVTVHWLDGATEPMIGGTAMLVLVELDNQPSCDGVIAETVHWLDGETLSGLVFVAVQCRSTGNGADDVGLVAVPSAPNVTLTRWT